MVQRILLCVILLVATATALPVLRQNLINVSFVPTTPLGVGGST